MSIQTCTKFFKLFFIEIANSYMRNWSWSSRKITNWGCFTQKFLVTTYSSYKHFKIIFHIVKLIKKHNI